MLSNLRHSPNPPPCLGFTADFGDRLESQGSQDAGAQGPGLFHSPNSSSSPYPILFSASRAGTGAKQQTLRAQLRAGGGYSRNAHRTFPTYKGTGCECWWRCLMCRQKKEKSTAYMSCSFM